MEVADIFVINKSDRADDTRDIQQMLELSSLGAAHCDDGCY